MRVGRLHAAEEDLPPLKALRSNVQRRRILRRKHADMHQVPDSEVGVTLRPCGLAMGAARVLAIVALQLIVGGACRSERICDPELAVGSTYTAEMLEYYTPSSSAYYDYRYAQQYIPWPSCNGFDGLSPGASLSVTVTDSYLYRGDCKQLDGTVNGLPNGEKWTEDPSATVSAGFGEYEVLSAVGRLVSGPCRGRHNVIFGRPPSSSSLFTVAEPGTSPNMVLGRSFLPEAGDGGSLCGRCGDTFVAWLKR